MEPLSSSVHSLDQRCAAYSKILLYAANMVGEYQIYSLEKRMCAANVIIPL